MADAVRFARAEIEQGSQIWHYELMAHHLGVPYSVGDTHVELQWKRFFPEVLEGFLKEDRGFAESTNSIADFGYSAHLAEQMRSADNSIEERPDVNRYNVAYHDKPLSGRAKGKLPSRR